MKNFKRIISLIMAFTVVASFVGCTKKTDENKKIELTIWETQGTDYTPKTISENDVVAKWLEEKTNVTVKNMYGNDGGQWDAKLTKLVAGDNLPDMVHCGAYQGPAHFSKLKQLNSLYELTESEIKKYAPNLWERTPQELWDNMKTEDGKIMGIPYRLFANYDEPFGDMDAETKEYLRNMLTDHVTDVTYLPTQYLWIRDDILTKFYPEAKTYQECLDLLNERNEQIGDELLDIPIKTTEEFTEFLYKIKDANLKENGKKIYPMGYNGGDNWLALTWLGADMFGYKNHSYSGTFNYKTQKYELMLAHDTVKEAAKLQNQMLNDEVIESESLAQTAALYKEKVLNGQYAIVSIYQAGQPDVVNAELERLGKTFRYRPFITQIPNKEEYPAFKEKTLWNDSICFLKTMSEDEVHRVLNWINVQYSDEFEQVRNWGPKELGLYEENADGTRKFKDERFNKYFIEGDKTALTKEETMGLGERGSMCGVYPLYKDKWDPVVVNRSLKYTPRSDSGFKFKADSEHVKNVKEYPPTQIWSPIFADIPEVVAFWSSREQWESKIRIALAAEPGTFETRWQEMLDTVSNIVDIEAFEKATTDAVQPYLNK